MVVVILLNECALRLGGQWYADDVYQHCSEPGDALYVAATVYVFGFVGSIHSLLRAALQRVLSKSR
jgi:hypothetical protein